MVIINHNIGSNQISILIGGRTDIFTKYISIKFLLTRCFARDITKIFALAVSCRNSHLRRARCQFYGVSMARILDMCADDILH